MVHPFGCEDSDDFELVRTLLRKRHAKDKPTKCILELLDDLNVISATSVLYTH